MTWKQEIPNLLNHIGETWAELRTFAPQANTVNLTNTPLLLPMEQFNMGQDQIEIW